MTDLVIINPAASHGIYGPLGDDLIAVEPPLWCRLIAGYVQDQGFSVEIVDAEAARLGPEATVEWVQVRRPKLVCIAVYGHQPSASTQQMWGAGQVARELQISHRRLQLRADRSHSTDYISAPVIMLGGHPSALPEHTLLTEPVDYVGVGEGHLTVLGLLRGDDIATIPGLVWRDGKRAIRRNQRPPLCEDFRELHGSVWDKLPMELYRAHNWQCLGDLEHRAPYASVYTSLGCSFGCSFCCINAPFGTNRYRTRRPEDVVDEIEYLHEEHGVSIFKITDEMFVLNPKHYRAICEDLIARGLGPKLNLWAYARVDTVKENTLPLLRAAGIRWLALGIESGSKHVRDGAEKHLGTDDIVGVVKRIQAAGINVIGNFMFGLRDDTVQTMQDTLDLALACLPDFANFYCTMAYPGSSLYQQAVTNGWILPQSWRGYSQHNDDCRPLDTEYVEAARVLQFRDDAFNTFFGSDVYRRLVLGKFGEDALAHIDRMATYKLERKLLRGKHETIESERAVPVSHYVDPPPYPPPRHAE
jgi:anaerobic magnesium-protoporphyrin IX monomethyl ester cyclase